jgi:hypothetical protein
MGVITDYDIMQILGTDFDYVFFASYTHTRWHSGHLANGHLVGIQHLLAMLLSFKQYVACFLWLDLVAHHGVWAGKRRRQG